MSVPVTTRLDERTLVAVDEAVAAGLGASRAAIVADAVDAWLARHGEAAIVESYRRRYASVDSPPDDELIGSIASFSAAACLASEAP